MLYYFRFFFFGRSILLWKPVDASALCKANICAFSPAREPCARKNHATFRAFKDEGIAYSPPWPDSEAAACPVIISSQAPDGSKWSLRGFQNKSLPFWPRNFCSYSDHTECLSFLESHLEWTGPEALGARASIPTQSPEADIPVSGVPRT